MTIILNVEVRGNPEKRFVRLPKALAPKLAEAIISVQNQYVRFFTKTRFLPSPGAKAIVEGTHPKEGVYQRTGDLRGTVRTEKPTGVRTLRGAISIGTSYAKLHEFGGIVKPTGGRRYLTIPLPAALTRAGKPRFEGHLRKVGGGWQTSDGRDVDLVTRDDEGKPPLIVDSDTRVPLFVLRESVKVPPHLGFFDTWRDVKLVRFRQGKLREALEKAVEDSKDA